MDVKIAHLITSLNVGGAEKMLLKHLSILNRSRFDPVVITLKDGAALSPAYEALGVRIYSLGIKGLFSILAGLFRLMGILRRERPDILLSWLYHADLMALLAGKMTSVPRIIWNIRCSDMEMRHYSPVTRVVFSMLAHLSGLPDAAVVNSLAGRKVHEEKGFRPKTWHYIPNGFDTDMFHPDPRAALEKRRKLGVSEDAIVIGLVSRLDPMKGVPFFMQAARSLQCDLPDVHFVVAGPGMEMENPDFASIVAAAGPIDHLHALGEQEDVARLLVSFDILTLSSLFGEGFPNIIGEAMACGVPCVATDVGDTRIILEDCGRVIPPASPDKMMSAWKELIDLGKETRHAIGAKARAIVEEKYSISQINIKYENLYDSYYA